MRIPNCFLQLLHSNTRRCPEVYRVSSKAMNVSHLGHLTRFIYNIIVELFFEFHHPSRLKFGMTLETVEGIEGVGRCFEVAVEHFYGAFVVVYECFFETFLLKLSFEELRVVLGNMTSHDDSPRCWVDVGF